MYIIQALLIVLFSFNSQAFDHGDCMERFPESNSSKCYDTCNGMMLFSLGLAPYPIRDHQWWIEHQKPNNYARYRQCVDPCGRIADYELRRLCPELEFQ